MPTLFVTKDTGGKTVQTLMTVAPPDQLILEDQVTTPGQQAGLNSALFANLLSGFVQLERDAVHLYRCVAEKTQFDAWRAKYEEFGRQSEDHIRIYEDLIAEAGGDPQYVSPNARMREFVDTKLMEAVLLTGSVDQETVDLTCLETVLSAERQCHANWHLLGKLSEVVSDEQLKASLKRACDQVAPQEDEHVEWAKTTWEETMLCLLTNQPVPERS